MSDHYKTMGLEPGASADEIKARYRELRSKYHPDREGGDAEKMASVNVAYETLSDPERRAHYDSTGENSPPVLEKQAREILCGMIVSLLEGSNGDADFSRPLREILQQELTKARASIIEGGAYVRRTEKIMRRLRYKGAGTDYVMVAFETRLEDLKNKVAKNQLVVDRLVIAQSLADEYGYEIPLGELFYGGALPMAGSFLIGRMG